MNTPVLIVGGGLAGLTAAHHLHQAGIGFQLLEARDRLGGRILSTDASGRIADDGFDLGPSWFWPGMQSAMSYLVDDLALPFFAQHSEGDTIFQRTPNEAPRRFRGYRQEPESMRLTGGIGAVVSTLASGLPAANIQLGARVTQLRLAEMEVKVAFTAANSTVQRMNAQYVLVTVPPRLLEATVAFSPALDAETATASRQLCPEQFFPADGAASLEAGSHHWCGADAVLHAGHAPAGQTLRRAHPAAHSGL